MATKGASNHYGNARGGRQGHITAHTGFDWAKGFNKSTLTDHADRHGGTGGTTKYVANAVAFANRVDRANHLSYIRKDGTTVKYSKKTNEFAVIDKNGIVKTYFKPANGIQKYLKDKEEHT